MVDPEGRKPLVIEGRNIRDVPSFYAEINRVFMAGEDWQLGDSLDALNDMLYGSYGALSGTEPATILWRDIASSRVSLGVEATIAFLRGRPSERSMFNGAPIAEQLEALENGHGKTYFDIVMEVVADHPSIDIICS